MEYNQFKSFNLREYRPQVLVLGNGLGRAYSESSDWENFIKNCVRDNIVYDKCSDISSYTIKATAVMDTDDKFRRNKYEQYFKKFSYQDNELIERILDIPFDAILTTNYTYEIEHQILPEYIELKDKSKYACSSGSKAEGKYLLSTYNHLEKNEVKQDIWHIHGEVRRKSSIILTHDEYARLVKKILDYNSERKNYYQKYCDNVHCKSWIDYFIVGDLYILGQGMDFAEFDLWWLLNRRLREKSAWIGRITYYLFNSEGNESEGRKYELSNALRALNVDVKELSLDANEKQGDDYICFYRKAIDDIKQSVRDNHREVCSNVRI